MKVKFRLDFFIEANNMGPDQTTPMLQYEPWSDYSHGRSLIWAHIVCNTGYLRTKADERAYNKSRGLSMFFETYYISEWPELKFILFFLNEIGFFLISYMFFSADILIIFLSDFFRSTIRVKVLIFEKARHFVRPDLGPNC